MTETLVSIIVLVFGAVVGSFLNVVIIRSHGGHTFSGGRSHCPHCRRNLAWWELIPVVSFLALRGRCRTCRSPIHWQYPLVEILTAAAFYGSWQFFHWSPIVFLAWFVSATMIMIAVYDARWTLIPDGFTVAFVLGAVALIVANRLPWFEHLLGAVTGAAFFGLQYILSRRRWVGSGDLLLGMAIGLLLGWRMLGLALFLAYTVGSLVAAIFILVRRLKLRQSMAFGPYLILATYVVWLWGEPIINWYFEHALFR